MAPGRLFPTRMVQSVLLLGIASVIVCLHLLFLAPGVDAGIHMYGSYLLTRGLLPFQYLWNNKPPLIYCIGWFGFIIKSNPFLGVRMIEIAIYFFNLTMIHQIAKRTAVEHATLYSLTFSVIYLLCWDQGFLTETFIIPLMLLTTFLLLRKTRHFEWIGSLLLFLAFLLKQNAIFPMAGILAVDLFTSYRASGSMKKLSIYILAFFIYGILFYSLLKGLGIEGDFVDQVFVYNSRHFYQDALFQMVMDHFFHNSFLSFKGISILMIFNIVVLLSAWKYWNRRKQATNFALKDLLVIYSMLIYCFSYLFVYVSGKTYAHYFMLLIVPFTFIAGHFAIHSLAARIALVILLIIGLISNFSGIPLNRKIHAQQKEIAGFIQSNGHATDKINVAGIGNQYLYILSDRLCNSSFIVPLFNNDGYSEDDKKRITEDFENSPPRLVIFSKRNYRSLDGQNIYVQILERSIAGYRPLFENELFLVYGKQ